MKNDLTLIRSAISLPGVKITKTSLIFDNKITDDELAHIGASLIAIDGCRLWWIGDYGVTLTDRKGDKYTRGHAEALGVEVGTFWNYVSVARFFHASVRTEALSFAHHFVAMMGTGSDIVKAQDWLDKAKASGWSVSELRKQINLSKATAPIQSVAPLPNGFKFFDSADEWAAINNQRVLSVIEPEEAQILLNARFMALVQFIDGLRSIAAKSQA